jgi:DNA-binding transcriptional regulator YiaG
LSTLAFRNVETSSEDPVSSWPLEAIQTALERGGLSDWRHLAAAVDSEPWGPVARRIEEALTYSRPFGVTNAFERVIVRARANAEASERDQVAQEVKRLIEESGLTRAEFASRIGTSASRLSTYATGKVTPSAALLFRMQHLAGATSLVSLSGGGSVAGPNPTSGR